MIIKKAITISSNASLLDARETLLRHNLKRLVVIDSSKHPVGIITEKDIAKTNTQLRCSLFSSAPSDHTTRVRVQPVSSLH